jgi:hypothetical protein
LLQVLQRHVVDGTAIFSSAIADGMQLFSIGGNATQNALDFIVSI